MTDNVIPITKKSDDPVEGRLVCCEECDGIMAAYITVKDEVYFRCFKCDYGIIHIIRGTDEQD